MSPFDAIGFVSNHGIVLASAKGPVPNLADAVAGEAIRGSWWGHPAGKRIFAALRGVEECDDVLCCNVIAGKRTFVHARCWPALVRCAGRFPLQWLAWVRELHTASGKHVREETPYPAWVPAAAVAQARALDESAALALLGEWAR